MLFLYHPQSQTRVTVRADLFYITHSFQRQLSWFHLSLQNFSLDLKPAIGSLIRISSKIQLVIYRENWDNMKSVQIMSRRFNLRGIGKRNGDKISRTTMISSSNGIGGTNKCSLSRFGSRSRYFSTVGSCAPSISSGDNVAQVLLNGPSAVTSTLTSLLEYEGEDEDGT